MLWIIKKNCHTSLKSCMSVSGSRSLEQPVQRWYDTSQYQRHRVLLLNRSPHRYSFHPQIHPMSKMVSEASANIYNFGWQEREKNKKCITLSPKMHTALFFSYPFGRNLHGPVWLQGKLGNQVFTLSGHGSS